VSEINIFVFVFLQYLPGVNKGERELKVEIKQGKQKKEKEGNRVVRTVHQKSLADLLVIPMKKDKGMLRIKHINHHNIPMIFKPL
jgi:hypothetical protein